MLVIFRPGSGRLLFGDVSHHISARGRFSLSSRSHLLSVVCVSSRSVTRSNVVSRFHSHFYSALRSVLAAPVCFREGRLRCLVEPPWGRGVLPGGVDLFM